MSLRKIRSYIIHCTGSDYKEDWGVNKVIKYVSLKKGLKASWNKKIWTKEWSWKFSYHWHIKRDGVVRKVVDEERVGAHAKGFNKSHIGICFDGYHTITTAQLASLINFFLERNESTYEVLPHNAVNSKKDCPNLNLEQLSFFVKNPKNRLIQSVKHPAVVVDNYGEHLKVMLELKNGGVVEFVE